jgi:lysophospholipase L1-like esterase
MFGCGSGIAPLPPLNVPQTDDIIFIGDSHTYLWGQDQSFQTHPNWISTGISGETSYQVAQRFVPDAISHYPRTIHILVGTNDLNPYNGFQPCTEPSYGVLVPNDICANLLYMVQTAQYYGIKVVIGTIPPWGCAGDPACSGAAWDQSADRYTHTAQLNVILQDFAKRHNLSIIDYHTLLQDTTGLHYGQNLTGDGVHPDSTGFSLMAPLAADAVK